MIKLTKHETEVFNAILATGSADAESIAYESSMSVVKTPAGQLYFIQTFQEVTGYDRRYTSSGTTVVPRIQTDTVSVVTISKQQVLTRRKLPTPILSSLHYAWLIPRGPELFFLMHASAKDSLPFFYLARMRTDLALGLVTDKDTDANGEQVKDEQPKQKKAKIDNARFNKAIEAIKNGEYQIEKLIETFDLDFV